MKYSKEATKHINNLYARIVELEKECDALKHIIVAHQVADETGYVDGEGWVENYSEMCETVSILLQANNLEQQAKILKQLAREAYTDTKEGCTYHMLLTQKALELTRQAKQLREVE